MGRLNAATAIGFIMGDAILTRYSVSREIKNTAIDFGSTVLHTEPSNADSNSSSMRTLVSFNFPRECSYIVLKPSGSMADKMESAPSTITTFRNINLSSGVFGSSVDGTTYSIPFVKYIYYKLDNENWEAYHAVYISVSVTNISVYSINSFRSGWSFTRDFAAPGDIPIMYVYSYR